LRRCGAHASAGTEALAAVGVEAGGRRPCPLPRVVLCDRWTQCGPALPDPSARAPRRPRSAGAVGDGSGSLRTLLGAGRRRRCRRRWLNQSRYSRVASSTSSMPRLGPVAADQLGLVEAVE
jgi:hypothetical protein